MGIVDRYLRKLNTQKQRFRRTVAVLTALSILVMLAVSWNLRQTGITLANDACCGMTEHRHTEECLAETRLLCGYAEETKSQETVPEEIIPQEIETEETEPTETAPTEAEPEETASEETAPEETASEETAPEETAPEETAPEETAPEETVPEETAPEETVPEETASEETAPEETASEEATESTEETKPAVTEGPHIHSEACYQITYLCGLEEHIHELACYSDVMADLEDWSTWAESLPELTGRISEDIVLVAQSQLGIRESERNFELGMDGETRNGITRYGQWFGNPYGPWSSMFTSFCLRFAGLTNVPVNSGAEAMRMAWEEASLYRYAGGYEPVAGDIVFFDKNENGTAEATGVVVKYFDYILTIIEGDVDNAVSQQEYLLDDPVIMGYGMTNPGGRVQMFAANKASTAYTVAQTVTNNNNQLAGNTFLLYTTASDGKHYAIDGNGNAVEVQISNTGAISATIDDPNLLYWTFANGENYNNQQTFVIQNVSTKIHLHPNGDEGTRGPFHETGWSTYVHNSGGTVRFQGLRQNYYAMLSGSELSITNNSSQASLFKFGKLPDQVTLWLDGTNGNIMSYLGSDNTAYTVYSGIPVQLPFVWRSPTKYVYQLAGWVNIETGEYYKPGDSVTVTKNTVLYADWVASTYDIGQYNSSVVDTVSTSDFITTQLFDYSSLINLHSTKLSSSTISATTHSEKWAHAETGNAATGQTTLDFSFVDDDWNDGNYNNNLSDPADRSKRNLWTGEGGGVYSGILGNMGTYVMENPLVTTLFTSSDVLGKHYLGQGDHLFQINTDPRSEFYGYYYYDSRLNAASYNQSDQRFYVYDYLEASSDSPSDSYSDFMPLNSPYANINGSVAYDAAKNTYTYESRKGNNSPTRAEWWLGMRTDISFGLPDDVGTDGNKDLYGKEMHFHFSGDDDVWVLVDGELVLDLGGIHLAASGDINFTTGDVSVNDTVVGNIGGDNGIKAGEHTLTILYLERGASMGNCAIYFNLAPRFSLTLQKEDVLTQAVLNGARFQIYTDEPCPTDCTGEGCYRVYDRNYHKARLWPSQQAYKEDAVGNATNVFTIQNGQAYIWGLSPSETYYIKEITSPGGDYFDTSDGLIRITLDKKGLNSDGAVILEETDANGNKKPITNGFTVHGFQVDEEEQAAYLSITNAQNWVQHTTSVYVEKVWNDSQDHTYDSVTIYLQVTDPDGTVRRIRQINLSKENNWNYTWRNLPMYYQDSETGEESTDVPMVYSVVEAYVPGYQQATKVLENGSYIKETWQESTQLVNGDDFILKTSDGMFLSAVEGSDKLQMVDEATAKSSNLALWHVTTSISNGVTNYKLYNAATKRSLNYNSSSRYFNATTSTPTNLRVTPKDSGVILHYSTNNYMGSLNNNGYMARTGQKNSAKVFYPIQKTVTEEKYEIEGTGYRVTNTPLAKETSLKVTKNWNHPFGEDNTSYERLQVTLKLLADGVDTGRTETVSLKNNWTVTFTGLPYYGEQDTPIVYTVVETWTNRDWIPVYGEIKTIGGANPTYETTVTNHYRWGDSFELPGTGGIGMPLYILCGFTAAAAPLVYGLSLRRKERRSRA